MTVLFAVTGNRCKMSDFDARAADWDKKKRRVQLAQDVVSAIIKHVKPEKGIDIADFGTGTGLIMLGLSEYGKTMTGYDTSQGMMDVLMEKAKEAGLDNIKTEVLDIDTDDFPEESFDLVTCSMVIHHMDDPSPFICKAYKSLRKGGSLCISDLIETEIPFHDVPQADVKHNGFTKEQMIEGYKKCGFTDITIETAAVIEKERDGGVVKFPIFLAIGKK